MKKLLYCAIALIFCCQANAQDVLLDISVAPAGGEKVKTLRVEAVVGEETNVPADGPFRVTVIPSVTDKGYISLEFRRYDRKDLSADPLIGPTVLLVEGVEGGMTQTSKPARRDDFSVKVTSRLLTANRSEIRP